MTEPDSPYSAGQTPASKGDLDDLGARIVAMAGRLAAATCRWLLMVAEFDARDGSTCAGLATTAQWLGFACGIAPRTAIEHVRVARALITHARLAEEMTAGRLSYSHARAISRLAQPAEGALVEELIQLAEHATVRQLEATVRGLRTVRDVETPTGPPAEYATHTWTSENQWRLTARLDPERGAIVASAIAAVVRHSELSAADALVWLAEVGLAAIADEETDKPRTLRGEEKAAVVIHLDAARVRAPGQPKRSRERSRPAARVANGPGLPDDVVERLLCAGRVRTVVHGTDGDGQVTVLDVGRSHRLVTDRQYRALLLRDGGCGFPGCESTDGLEAHHVQHWLYGGRTDLANLVLCCASGIITPTTTGSSRSRRGDAADSASDVPTDNRCLTTSTRRRRPSRPHRSRPSTRTRPQALPRRAGTAAAWTSTMPSSDLRSSSSDQAPWWGDVDGCPGRAVLAGWRRRRCGAVGSRPVDRVGNPGLPRPDRFAAAPRADDLPGVHG